jgi:hypothetical protein
MKNKLSNNRIIKNLISLRKDLFIIFIISMFTILLIDFWLINIPELFTGGEKLGQIIYKLCFAYISAFIFYFLVIHLKNQKDKENLNDYISKNLALVIGQGKSLISSLARASNITLLGSYPTNNELNNICNVINPNANAPLFLHNVNSNANWLQYFDYYKSRSNEATRKILSKLQFIDSVLVNKLAVIEDCSHFRDVSMFAHIKISNTNLTAFIQSLKNYFELIEDLENYYKQHFNNI